MGYHYDHLAYIEQEAGPRATFEQIAELLAAKYSAERKGDRITLDFNKWLLYVIFCDEAHILIEAKETAERYDIPKLAGCPARLEIHSLREDHYMGHFNDVMYVLDLINDHPGTLIFDPVNGSFIEKVQKSMEKKPVLQGTEFLQFIIGNPVVNGLVISLRKNYVNPLEWTELGQAYAAQYMDDLALKCYETAWTQDHKAEIAYRNAGWIWSRRGDRNRAIEMYEKAAEANPDCFDYWNWLSRDHQEKGNVERAIFCIEKAISVSYPYDRSHTYAHLATRMAELGQPERAGEIKKMKVKVVKKVIGRFKNL